MRNKYLFLSAASVLMLASCSNEADAPKGPETDVNENVLALTSLTSQESRIVAVDGTRDGEKKERLQLKYKIAPVADAQEFTWSATGIAFANNGMYVSWHSDKQAKNPATKWGGALDVIAFVGETPTFSNTYVNYDAKFNNVVAGPSAFYLPLTDAKKGAAVARVNYGGDSGVVRKLAGSSANYLSIKDGKLYAVTGYKGGVFSVDANYPAVEDGKIYVDTIVAADNFGGKYIDGDLVLRTDDQAAYIYNVVTREEWNIGAPLVSSVKDAEEYDPETGKWTMTGNTAAYYGKHTLAQDDNYIYVAGGKAEKGSQNGLRVIDKATKQQVWGNATNTTAVCVAGDYVYAATGAGLRVYKKYDGSKLELFAFESLPVLDENGEPVINEEGKVKREPGTDAHSCNFVAVNGDYIYMANGQSGVYMFKLDTTAPAQEEEVEE